MKDPNTALERPLTKLDVEAFIDTQMDPETEKRVWFIIKNNPHLYNHYQMLNRQKKLLQAWWQSETDKSRFDCLFH